MYLIYLTGEPETLHFVPYSAKQISSIIQTRLNDLCGSLVEKDAIDFCAGKVSAQSADVRSALEIMRFAKKKVMLILFLTHLL